ncbi:MAG: 2-oxoacid:ferredoxin oxidoreductase subunit beta [Planctomycetes bacterium]|nr:2-oxoacid:ferredoxin oxidoreductase subunit beta [Planctomycetota bacterium]
MKQQLAKYFRWESFPTPFCNGCGHGILMKLLIEAVDELKLDWKKTVFVSGIGCAAWIPSPHFSADTMHTTHGRAIAFAAGIKSYNPELNVIVVSGDGDLTSIGGNHLIHAARRNIRIPVICANNNIYGMTGGQFASTTPLGSRTVTTPKGSSEPPFDLMKLVIGAGATYAARATVWHYKDLLKYIKTAIVHSLEPKKGGFAFVDAVTYCHSQYGRRNNYASSVEMLRDLRGKSFRAKSREELFLPPPDAKRKIVIGDYTAF